METLSTLLVLFLIATSAFLNGAEVAVFSLSKIQLKQMRERFKSAQRTIKRLLGDPAGLLAAILVSNEVVNISISTIIANAMSGPHEEGWTLWLATRPPLVHLPGWAIDLVLGTLVTSPILLIVAEITPKVVSARVNSLIAPMVAAPLSALYLFLAPVRFGVGLVEKGLRKLMPGDQREGPLVSAPSKLREEDFLSMVEEAQKEGTVQSTELELIRNVFDLDDTPAIEIATPLSRVFMLSQDTTLHQALQLMKEGSQGHRYSRIPVYGKNRADVVGVLYSKDLLVARLEKVDPNTPISELMWKAFFVNAQTFLNSLFRKLKRQKVHLAIVTNHQGVPIGVVTMNDVLEALLDELIIPDDEDEDEAVLGGIP